MKKISVRGTLGDCYTACLKLLKEEDIHIFHYTVHKQFYNEIKEIYNLFHNIRKVEFIEFLFPESKEVSGVPEEGMVWFPELYLPYLPICGAEYIVICPHTGREDAMARKIPMETINRMIELLDPIPVVLIGTDKRYKDIKCYKNLIN
ncbi:MAG: hypothetical protein KKB31_01960, partial [Nanoarchaeota archaeon]|nr:hypothetical protein [Nanoarchaeota archaeon]